MALIGRDITDCRALSFAEAVVALRWHPFCLQASKEAFHWRIIPAVTPPTHTLLYPVATQGLAILAAGIVAYLDALEHDACWPTA